MVHLPLSIVAMRQGYITAVQQCLFFGDFFNWLTEELPYVDSVGILYHLGVLRYFSLKRLFNTVELTTFSRRWLTHTVYETKGVFILHTMVVAFHWVRVRVYYIVPRVCQPCCRKGGKVPLFNRPCGYSSGSPLSQFSQKKKKNLIDELQKFRLHG